MNAPASPKPPRSWPWFNIITIVIGIAALFFNARGPLAPSTLDKIPAVWGEIAQWVIKYSLALFLLMVAGNLGYLVRGWLLGKYRKALAFALRPVASELLAGGMDQWSPFEIQSGEFPVSYNRAEYRQGKVIFAKPFAEEPIVVAAECRGGNWLLVKIDGKSRQEFAWAASPVKVRCLPEPQPPTVYSGRIQWIAIAPKVAGLPARYVDIGGNPWAD
jgi:hypothetical protein